MKKLTTEEFILKSQLIHGYLYDYSLVNYNGSHNKISIKCKNHGEFFQKPNSHLNGNGCPKCANKNITNNEFIMKSKNIHGNKYLYDLCEYINSNKRVKIICSECNNIFFVRPSDHIFNKSGCPKCEDKKNGLKKRMTSDKFIDLSIKKHGLLYDYKETKYIHSRIKVIIECKEHGIFEQRPHDHLNGKGCPICSQSTGEIRISNYLKSNKFEFISEKQFKNCAGNKRLLPFDFYIPEYNILIEYDGIQHYEPINFFGGIDSFKNLKRNDKIKDDFAKKQGIRLIRISYKEYDNIEAILDKIFN